MNMITPTSFLAEVPAYVTLQREMHAALIAQHPEWIEANGNSAMCDDYDRRFAQLLISSVVFERTRDRTKMKPCSMVMLRSETESFTSSPQREIVSYE